MRCPANVLDVHPLHDGAGNRAAVAYQSLVMHGTRYQWTKRPMAAAMATSKTVRSKMLAVRFMGTWSIGQMVCGGSGVEYAMDSRLY